MLYFALMFSVCKKELRQFFSSLTGYIAIIVFLLVNGLVLFVFDDNILDFGYATLDRFFQLAPWILLLLIPAITMRSFAEEFKTGTYEILQTRPLSRAQIIAGKYFGSLVVVVIALLPTLIYIFSLQRLSSNQGLDMGATIGSYIGLFFLAAVFTAISISCSSFTNNAVVAFIISLIGCALLYYGFSAISKLPALRNGPDYYVEMIGIDFHYRSISRGLLDTRDLVYFGSIILLFLGITSRNLLKRSWWLLLLVILLAVNYLASVFHARFDLTKEKRYTLSKATKDLVKNLDDDVQVDVFLKGQFPAGFKKLATSTEEFLALLKDRNGAKIHYRFISPQDEIPEAPGKIYEDTLVGLGANPIALTVKLKAGEENKRVYPVALVKYKDRQALVSLYSGGKRGIGAEELNSAEALMEYQFAKTLDGLINPSKPLVAYSIGNGEPTDYRTYDLQQTLKNDYKLFTININEQKFIPDTIKLLLVVKPVTAFTETEKLKIDQYIMRGGKVMWFIDNLIAEQDSLRYKPETIAYDRNLNLTDMLFKYGVRINTDLVMDLQCDFIPLAVNGSSETPQFEFVHWNYYPLFESNGNHTINKNTGLIAGRFVNSIDTITTPGVKKTVLLASSANSRIISTPALISLNENKNAPEDSKFKRNAVPVAYLLEGKFTSLFRNRASQAQIDSIAATGSAFTEMSTGNKMIVVGDGDILLNDLSPKEGPLPMGLNFYTLGSQYEYQFANRDFLLNCMEYLVNKPGIIETRNKDIVLRLLDTQKVAAQKTTWQFINIGLPILLVILLGWIYQQVRKSKYAA
ncbi:MAG: gliding motility-associated ABC transporter substrate-binding protein GldG [Bacteroidota bacterium]